jgi:hypothetical protein
MNPSPIESDAGNNGWVRTIDLRNLPFMDGTHHCIPSRAPGQQFSARFFGHGAERTRGSRSIREVVYCKGHMSLECIRLGVATFLESAKLASGSVGGTWVVTGSLAGTRDFSTSAGEEGAGFENGLAGRMLWCRLRAVRRPG